MKYHRYVFGPKKKIVHKNHSGFLETYWGLALRLPHMKKRDKSLAILYSLGDAINIVHQTNTGRARKQELGDRSFKG